METLVALALTGVALLTLTVVTARAPAAAVPGRQGYLDRWQRLHGGHDPRTNVWLRGWLMLAYTIARPLARRGTQPHVLTLWTTWLALAVIATAQAGGRWPILGGAVLVASGLGDTLDGAVAALTERATRWGYVVDSMVDRLNDGAYLVAVWLLGAPGWLATGTGVTFGLLEYLRARAANAGAGEVGAVTVGERSTRVILCAAALLAGGAVVDRAELVVTLATAVLAVLSLVGLVQLTVAVRRRLGQVPA